MGGSGGGWYDVTRIIKDINEQKEEIFKRQLEADVAALLSEILADANNRNTEAINTHIQEILNALGNEIEGSINLMFGGSVAKHTFVDGLSDVDLLLVINDSDLADKSPSGIKSRIFELLEARFPRTKISIGNLAVTLGFSDYELQIIPAIKVGEQIRIPRNSKSWSDKIDTYAFSSKLTELNKSLNNKLVPIIKLVKAITYDYPENKRMTGYHIESLAIEVFKDYKGQPNTVQMLKDFFEGAAQIVKRPIVDKTGQSRHVDDYLGKENSLERDLVSDALRNTLNKMKSYSTIEQWSQLFE